jgi:hypothetical protein
MGGRKISWVEGPRFTLLSVSVKGFQRLVEGETYYKKTINSLSEEGRTNLLK